MKFTFLTYLFCRFPLEYSFRMAREYGYDGIEIWGARPHAYVYDMDAARTAEINGLKKKYALEISMLTPELLAYPYNPISRYAAERRDTIEYLLKNIEFAAAVGTNKMLVAAKHPGYGIAYDKTWEYLTHGVSELCKRAEALGVDIVFEVLSPSEGILINTADQLAKLIREVNSPALKGMLDVVPPVIANEPLSEYFDKLGDKMEYIHICDSDSKTEAHLQLGEGDLPIADALRIFKRCGYDGWCSLELLAPYFKDPELYLSQGTRIIKRYAVNFLSKTI